MDEKQPKQRKKRSVAAKIGRTFLHIVLVIIVLLISVALLILTPPVQNFIRKKATTWLSHKLDTRVDVGRIYIGFPKKIVLEDIYVEDQQKDTLLAGGKVQVDIAMLKLLKNEVEVSQVQIEELTAKVKRKLPDTAYNFQFIIDAFDTGDTTTATPQDSSSMKISVKEVELDKIRLVYDDVVTGNDMALWLEHFDTEIDEFDLDKMRFSVPETNISGIRANVYQRTPLVQTTAEPEAAPDTAAAAAMPDLDLGTINLKDVYLDYGNDPSAMYTRLNLGKLVVAGEDMDLNNESIVLNTIELDNTTAAVRLGKTPGAQDVEQAASEAAKEAAHSDSAEAEAGGWRILVKNLQLNNNNVAFSNDNEPVAKQGMDYAHIDAKNITFHADNFLFAPDSIAASVTKGELTEKSGFQLKTFQTDFLYASNQAYLKNLLLQTPGTTLRRSAAVHYTSLEAVQKDIGSLQLDIDLQQSRIQVKDILTFAPFLAEQPAFSNPSAMLMVNGDIDGSVANMNIRQLQLRAFNNTSVDVHGHVAGLPNADKVSGNLVIGHLRTSKQDIELLAPKGSLPTNITIPSTMNLSGTVAGSMADARADLDLVTNLGNVSVDGTVSNATDSIRAKYDATIAASQLQLGVIMQNDTLFGPLSATVDASGTGYAMKTADAKVKAVVNSAVLNRYTYKDVDLQAKLADQLASFGIDIDDPNIAIALNGTTDLSKEFPSISIKALIDSIKPNKLNFLADTLAYAGKIYADFPNTDPENLEGQLVVSSSVLSLPGQQVILDTIAIESGNEAKGKFLRMRSDAINFNMTGRYNLVQLGSVFQQAIQPYYTLGAENKDTLDDYDFTFTGQVVNGPLLKSFAPTLDSLETVNLNGRFTSGEGFRTSLTAPLIIVSGNRIDNLRLNAGTKDSAIAFTTSISKVKAGETVTIYATGLNARIADNKVDFMLNLKDSANKNKYRLGGLFEQPKPGSYALSLNPDSLLLNYEKWTIAATNRIKLDSGDINIRNFAIASKGQQLSLNSATESYNAPLTVSFGNFRIATLTAFAKQDSLLVDGTIDGNVVFTNIPEQPTFTTDLNIANLMFRADTVGNLAMKVDNKQADIFNANITLTGNGNDIAIGGTYSTDSANTSPVDMILDIRRLQMKSLEAMAMGAISRAKGFLSGKFDVNGSFDKPKVDGQLGFNQVGFSPSALGSYFTIDKENIAVTDKGIVFNSFSILDETKNELNLDGTAYTTDFTEYRLDLSLTADNFQALNSPKQQGKLFYGKFNFDTDLNITGTATSPKVDGLIRVNDNTDFTAVLPQSDPGVVEREGIIRFVDADSLHIDSTVALAKVDSLQTSDITGMDINVNIEINKEAIMTLVIDEANGDFLKMQGSAELNGGIDPSGKTTLSGTYELNEGEYQMSLNFLKRSFEIKKGSTITWLGEPTKANMDLTAVYVSTTAPLPLIESSTEQPPAGELKQKLPFHVNLNLDGQLLKPEISFDLFLPENELQKLPPAIQTDIETRLDQLQNEPSELNKQVFALLLLNRFVAENPFASSGDGFNAESVARQSVSQLLSDQLNSLASDLISGVDLNFDLESTNEDYSSGTAQKRTDLNVSLSKSLLNDRLKVTVGSNFELEGSQQSNRQQNTLAGNVAVDYLLSRDGRYMLRAYRTNEYEGQIEGYIIETGLNFILTFDFEKFGEIFHNREEEKVRKAASRKEAPANDSTKAATDSTAR